MTYIMAHMLFLAKKFNIMRDALQVVRLDFNMEAATVAAFAKVDFSS